MKNEGFRKQLLIFGMGGHALVILDLCRLLGYEVVGYFAEKEAEPTMLHEALPVYLGAYDPAIYPNLPVVVAIGNNAILESLSKQVTLKTYPNC